MWTRSSISIGQSRIRSRRLLGRESQVSARRDQVVRVGLLATQGIRGGANSAVLDVYSRQELPSGRGPIARGS